MLFERFDLMKPTVRADVLAGLTAAAVVAPKAMAYATIAGLPVQVGLYTRIVPMAVYAALGTSRPLSVSTTTTIAILSAAAAGPGRAEWIRRRTDTGGGDAGDAGRCVLLLAAALRLGFVANFISEPVLTGFKSGIGLVIVVDQMPKLLGIHITKARILQRRAGDRPAASRHLHRDAAGGRGACWC